MEIPDTQMQQIAVHCSPRAIFDSWHLLGRGGAAIGGEWQGGWQRESFWQGSVSTGQKKKSVSSEEKKIPPASSPLGWGQLPLLALPLLFGFQFPRRIWTEMAENGLRHARGGGVGETLPKELPMANRPVQKTHPCFVIRAKLEA